MGNKQGGCCWNKRDNEENDQKTKNENEDENYKPREKSLDEISDISKLSNIPPNLNDSVIEEDNLNEVSAFESCEFQQNTKEISVPKVHSQNVTSVNFKNVFISLCISSLDIKCHNIDEFGTLIKPFIEISIDKATERTKIIENINTSLNISKNASYSDIYNNKDTSNNRSILNFSSIGKNNSNHKHYKEKNFTFKFEKQYKISQSQSFSSINFTIKNENGNFTTESNPNVIIGNNTISLRCLINKYIDSEFDGYLEIFNSQNLVVGLMKVYFVIKSKDDSNFNSNMINLDENQSNMNDNCNNDYSVNIYNGKYFHYEYFDETTIDKHFIFDFKNKQSNIRDVCDLNFEFLKSENVNDSNKFKIMEFDMDQIYEIYLKILNTKNMLLCHSLFILLNKIIDSDTDLAYDLVYKHFLCKINNKDNVELLNNQNDEKENNKNKNDQFNLIYNIPSFSYFNFFILKNYFMFVSRYIKHYKKESTEKKFFDDKTLILRLSETLKAINVSFKNPQNYSEMYKYEMNSVVLLVLDLLLELCTYTEEKNSLNKEKNLENFVQIYSNSMSILQKQLILLKIVERFSANSLVCSSLTRLFRKLLQFLLTPVKCTEKSNIIYERFKIRQEDLSLGIRKLIVEENEGILITSLKLIFSKFFHFPEIHLNINLILISLTSHLLDSEELILFSIADKFDFEALKTNFRIFRGKFVGLTKLINVSHLNLIKNFVTYTGKLEPTAYEMLSRSVFYCFRDYFKTDSTYIKRYSEFIERKLVEVNLQEICLNIAYNITKHKKMVRLMFDCEFYDDLIEYMIIIANGHEEETNENSTISKDFLDKILDKRKKKEPDSALTKIISNIVKYSTSIILNLYKSGDKEVISEFDKKVSFI